MRKHLAIRAIAVVVIGLAAYVLSPGKNARQRYVEAYYGRSLTEVVRGYWARLRKQRIGTYESARYLRTFRKMEAEAAIHFDERSFNAVTDRMRFWAELQSSWWNGRARESADILNPVVGSLAFVTKDATGLAIVRTSTNTITVLAPRDELPRWEEWIRNANAEAEKYPDW